VDTKVADAKRKGEEPDSTYKSLKSRYLLDANRISDLRDKIAELERGDDPKRNLKVAAYRREVIEIAREANKLYKERIP
jgi:hypothetical protein